MQFNYAVSSSLEDVKKSSFKQQDILAPQRRINCSQYIALCGPIIIMMQFAGLLAFLIAAPLSLREYFAVKWLICIFALCFLSGLGYLRLNDMEYRSRWMLLIQYIPFGLLYFALSQSDPKPNRFGTPVKKTHPLYFCLWLTYPLIIFAALASSNQLPPSLSNHYFTWRMWQVGHSSYFNISAPTSFKYNVNKDGAIVYYDDIRSTTLAAVRVSDLTLNFVYGEKIAFSLGKLASWEQVKQKNGMKIFQLANYDPDVVLYGIPYLSESINISTDKVFKTDGNKVRELAGTYKLSDNYNSLKCTYKYFRLRIVSHDNKIYLLSVNHVIDKASSQHDIPGTEEFKIYYNKLLKSRAFDNLYDKFFASFHPTTPVVATRRTNNSKSKIPSIKL